MNRRTFLHLSSSAALSAQLRALANTPIPMATLGKSGLRVTRIALGGFHAAFKGEENGVRLVERALDLGINLFDCAHDYHDGKSELLYGKALKRKRQSILLMSKVRPRDRETAMRHLEESLERLQTDYLDLWQIHAIWTPEEARKVLAPGGSLEAAIKAKEQGKVRHIGFTGHRDPEANRILLEGFDGWETTQHPVNLIDPHHISFIDSILPEERRKGLGVLGMKSNAIGNITKNRIATIPECLRFAWSQDIDTLVSGMETVEQLEQNVVACKTFEPMSKKEQQALLARTGEGLYGEKVELYKKNAKNGVPPLK